MDLKVALHGIEKTRKSLQKADLEKLRALNTAFRVEGFQMKNDLQRQIRGGFDGNPPLSIIARRWRGKRRSKALNRLALGIRYHVPNTAVPRLQVGFVGPVNKREHDQMVRSGIKLGSHGGYRGVSVGGMTSNSWRRLGYLHQKGFSRPVTAFQRAALARRGRILAQEQGLKMNSGRKKVSYDPSYRVFFLRKTTIEFRTPPRPIIDPFWARRKPQVVRNIRANYYKKMKGIKI